MEQCSNYLVTFCSRIWRKYLSLHETQKRMSHFDTRFLS